MHDGVFDSNFTPRYYTALANVGENDTIYIMIASTKIDDSTIITINELPVEGKW